MSDDVGSVDGPSAAAAVEFVVDAGAARAMAPDHADSDGLSAKDLDAIAVELADVEAALARLAAGQYWTDEISGRPLDEAFLAEHPTARTQPIG